MWERARHRPVVPGGAIVGLSRRAFGVNWFFAGRSFFVDGIVIFDRGWKFCHRWVSVVTAIRDEVFSDGVVGKFGVLRFFVECDCF